MSSCSRPSSASGASPGSHVRERVSTGPGHRRRPGGAGARPCTELAPAEEKASPLEPFRDGEPGELTNVGILTEGYDDPGIDCIVMARPTCSGLLYTQIAGRGVRPAPGKRHRPPASGTAWSSTCWTAAGSHASSLVTLPTLFGLPPGFDLRGRAATEVVREYHAAARMLGDSGIPEELAQQVLTPEDIRAMMGRGRPAALRHGPTRGGRRLGPH